MRRDKKDSGNAVSFTTINDDSYNVSLTINSVRDSALQGALLAILVILLFLHNFRTTLIIGISIPFSVLFSFVLMSIKGQGLNLMTLGGLTVAIGMIVDNSIVVLENIHKQYLLLGDAKKAASKGTAEVGGSIVASTTTTLVVFIPILFVRGFAGVILSDVALTIVWAIGASMIVALVVVPMLCAYLLKPDDKSRYLLQQRAADTWERGYGKVENFYRKTLNLALKNRGFVLTLTILLLGISVLSVRFLGFEFLSETDMNEINLSMDFPSTYTIEDTRNKMMEIDQFCRALIPDEIETSAFYAGVGDSFAISTKPNIGYARIRLVPNRQRKRTVFELIPLLRREIAANITDIDFSIENGGLAQLVNVATGGAGFRLEVFGSNLDDIYQSAQAIAAVMKQDPSVETVNLNINFNERELVSTLSTDYMGSLGVTAQEAAITSRVIFNGIETGIFRYNDKTYDMVLRSTLAGEEITDDILNTITLQSQTGNMISYANFSDLSLQNAVNVISKENKMKTITVTASLNNPDLRGIQNRVLPQIEKLDFPFGVNWMVAGSAASMQESFSSLFSMLLIGAFLVYMVMVIQFERFIQPLIIMASIPFAAIGIVAALMAFGSTLSIVSIMGIITLAGTVVNTAIVLIDYTNLLRSPEYNQSLEDAVVNGGVSRLKPILMSVLTTLIGLLPMAIGIGEGSEIYAPLGQAIFGDLFHQPLLHCILFPFCIIKLSQ
ncbi:efflux RND transporter permease subunit [Brucepastera parasyntrophica]|uniref:efflux RND transporter permease subunit n=1 Tax=Brucepastera parasyntrophica TaxID=2880008 RepID=UPI00210A2DDD|nr:efflux RND transporter permease subunit [Brucepastera parasyntrophica]